MASPGDAPGGPGPLEPDPRRWRRLDDLFREAVDLPDAERRAFVTWSCGDDGDLREQLEKLLEADADSERFVAATVAAGLSADRSTDGQPRIGPYRLLREIGRGGCGRVFLAERTEGSFGRRVAVKLLRPETGRDPDGDGILRRFLQERGILARLEHPGIARLYDGGTTEDGRPYLVMEAIDGRPIDRYADDRKLGLTERLELFQKVCRAVHYAHQNLVVHRDLKPSNVLVTADGEPKLLDFGIAKLLDPDLADDATRTALRPMTPEYASPEQVRGGPVTTTSDVYALGVLLYRLLAGHHPYRLDGASPAQVERLIAEDDPPPPSAVAVRGADRKRLAGDLDNIVARAMAKRPEHRYASAEHLALDLQRHLDGHPVEARPPTLAYRASRFLARHRLPATAVLAFGLLLVAFVASTLFQSARLAEERDRAERTAAVLVGLFEEADPGHGASVTAREILDRGVVRVREEITSAPELRATALETIARAYRNLGLYERAEPVLTEAVALRRSSLDRDDPRLASSLDQLGVIRALRGDYRGAEPLLARALEIRQRTLGPTHTETAKSLNNLALVRHDLGDFAGAEPLYRRALDLEETELGTPHPTAITNYGLLLHDLGRYAEAEERLRQTIRLRRSLASRRTSSGPEEGTGPDGARISVDIVYLAMTVRSQGRLDEAEALARRAAEDLEAGRGPDHPDTARALHVLGTVLADAGDDATAEPLLLRALRVRQQALGPDHPETAATHAALARLQAGRGDLDAARRLYGEALASFRESLPPGHPSTAATLLDLGELLVRMGDPAGARPRLERARHDLETALGPDHPDARRARERLDALRARQD